MKAALCLSLLLNCLLGIMLFKPPSIPPPPSAASALLAPSTQEPVQEELTLVAPVPAPQLWTTNLPQLIENLRAYGVPSQIIEDIVMGRLRADHDAKAAPLYKYSATYEFWKQGFYSSNRTPEDDAKLKLLNEQLERDAQELLGIDLKGDRLQWTTRRLTEMGIPMELHDAVSSVEREFQQRHTDLQNKRRQMEDGEWWREQRDLESEKLKAMAKLLPPEQFEQYELRESNVAQNLKYHIEGLDISEEEYKALFRLRKAEEVRRTTSLEHNEALRRETRQAYDSAKQLLGRKFEEARLNGIPEFRSLRIIAERTGTDPFVATEIWQMKSAATSAENELRRSELPPEEIQRRIGEIRSALRQETETKLGPRGFQMYRRAASWLLE